MKKIGAPGMIQSVDPSPDGQYFRVATMLRPFSVRRAVHELRRHRRAVGRERESVAQISKHGVRLAKDSAEAGNGGGGRGRGNGNPNDPRRGLPWMPQGASVYYLEPVPSSDRGADTTAPAERAAAAARGARPSRVVEWMPPFRPNDTKILYTSDAPISSVAFSDDAKTLFIADSRGGAERSSPCI